MVKNKREVLETDTLLLACGSRPHHLPELPMHDPDVHDSENILEIARAPKSLLVLGSGPAGCEFASIFAALGTRVTIVGGSHLLPHLDVEMAGVLAESFNSTGIRVIAGAMPSSVERVRAGFQVRLRMDMNCKSRRSWLRPGDVPKSKAWDSLKSAWSSTRRVGSAWTSATPPPCGEFLRPAT